MKITPYTVLGTSHHLVYKDTVKVLPVLIGWNLEA